MSQKEANKLFEGPHFDMSKEYAGLIKTMWLSAFYAPVMPFGIVISLLGIIFSYITDKYLLLRRYSRPFVLKADLNYEMLKYLELVPLFLSIGSIVFHVKVY